MLWQARHLLVLVRVYAVCIGIAAAVLAAHEARHGWHVVVAFAVLRFLLTLSVTLAVVVCVVSLRWVAVRLHSRWTVYVGTDGRAVLTVSTSRSGRWIVGNHLAFHRRRGAGAALRRVVVPALFDAAPSVPHIKVHVRPSALQSAVIRQFPGFRAAGHEILCGPTLFGEADALGRGSIEETLVRAIRERAHDASHTSGVIALTGPWGSGKSFVLARAARSLEFDQTAESRVRVVRFNPWLFSDEGALFAGFSDLLLAQTHRRPARRRLVTILSLIGPSSKFGAIDLSGTVRTVAGMLDPHRSTSSIEQVLASALSETDPLCVLVDDVDRLTADELLMLFKLVRLLGNVPNLHYVLAFDEETILTLLASTTIGGQDPVRARAYLEKMIEQRISVPAMTHEQVRTRVIDPVMSWPPSVNFSVPRTAMDRVETVLSHELSEFVTTVRLADRLVDAVQRLPRSLFGELDYADWVFSIWLRTVTPSVWTYVLAHRDDLTGTGLRRLWPGEDTRVLDLKGDIYELGFKGALADTIISILVAMFPRLPSNKRVALGSTSIAESEARRGIGANAASFDRYIWVDLPPGQLPDMRIIHALRALTLAGEEVKDRKALDKLFERDQSAVLAIVDRLWSDPSVPWPAVLQYLRLQLWDTSSPSNDPPGRSQVRAIAARVMYGMSETNREIVFALTTEHPDQWQNVFRELRPDELPPQLREHLRPPLADLRERAIDLIHSDLEQHDVPTVAEPDRLERYWQLSRIDSAVARYLLRSQVEAGRWPFESAAALLIQLYGSWPNLEHRGVPITEIVEVFGRERVLEYTEANPFEGAEKNYFFNDFQDQSETAFPASLLQAVRGALGQWRRAESAHGATSGSDA